MCMHARMHAQSSQLFATPWTVAHQTPLSMEFSRQEHWRELPFPAPRDLPDPGIEPATPASLALAGRFFTIAPPGRLHYNHLYFIFYKPLEQFVLTLQY